MLDQRKLDPHCKPVAARGGKELYRTLPGLSGIKATRRIIGERPDVSAALEAGAAGYLLKGRASEELIEAIRCVATGVYVARKPAPKESNHEELEYERQ